MVMPAKNVVQALVPNQRLSAMMWTNARPCGFSSAVPRAATATAAEIARRRTCGRNTAAVTLDNISLITLWNFGESSSSRAHDCWKGLQNQTWTWNLLTLFIRGRAETRQNQQVLRSMDSEGSKLQNSLTSSSGAPACIEGALQTQWPKCCRI